MKPKHMQKTEKRSTEKKESGNLLDGKLQLGEEHTSLRVTVWKDSSEESEHSDLVWICVCRDFTSN